jgi:DNA-binding transcriptional LysR family regulator
VRGKNFHPCRSALDVAQPSLTKAIKGLELKLGGALFYRNKFETRLTKLDNLVKLRLQKIRLEAELATEIAQRISSGA